MGYVFKGFQKSGTQLQVKLRSGKASQATVTKMPFVPQQYYKAQ